MSSISHSLQSSIGKKVLMAITGLFLISFLIVHCAINALIFVNDGGLLFNEAAHFMATNWLIRAMEVVLFLGIIYHIFLALRLTFQNRAARPVKYAANSAGANSRWYSRWMGLLGTLILVFLIVHLGDFWVKSRFTGLPGVDANGREDLYAIMLLVFKETWIVALYVFSMISLAYHLMHGFQSAFQSLGINHKKYTPAIKSFGFWFSIIISLIFASMPVAIYFDLVR